MAHDSPDWTSGVYTIPFTPPFMPGVDFPDWVDGVLSVAGLITPGEDFPDWTKATGQVGNVFPNPPPVAGYFAWYDATRIGGIPDNSPVSSWSDSSGNGYNMTATANRPTYRSSGATLINGNPVVNFDGAATFTTAPTMPAVAQPYTVAGVIQAVEYHLTGGGAPTFVGSGNGAVVLSVDPATTEYFVNLGSGAAEGGSADLHPHAFIAVINGTSSVLVIDGTTVITVFNPPSSNGLVSGATRFGIGQAGIGFFHGALGEVIFWNSALSAGNQTSIANYLRTKWGTP